MSKPNCIALGCLVTQGLVSNKPVFRLIFWVNFFNLLICLDSLLGSIMKPSIFAAIIFVSGYFLISHSLNKLGEWPDSVVDNNYKFCKIGDNKRCKKDDWFGIRNSELPGVLRDKGRGSYAHPFNIFCNKDYNLESSQFYRLVTLENGDQITFCRMLDRDKIEANILFVTKISETLIKSPQ